MVRSIWSVPPDCLKFESYGELLRTGKNVVSTSKVFGADGLYDAFGNASREKQMRASGISDSSHWTTRLELTSSNFIQAEFPMSGEATKPQWVTNSYGFTWQKPILEFCRSFGCLSYRRWFDPHHCKTPCLLDIFSRRRWTKVAMFKTSSKAKTHYHRGVHQSAFNRLIKNRRSRVTLNVGKTHNSLI